MRYKCMMMHPTIDYQLDQDLEDYCEYYRADDAVANELLKRLMKTFINKHYKYGTKKDLYSIWIDFIDDAMIPYDFEYERHLHAMGSDIFSQTFNVDRNSYVLVDPSH